MGNMLYIGETFWERYFSLEYSYHHRSFNIADILL